MTIAIRNSSSTEKNSLIKEINARKGENNVDWLKRARAGKHKEGDLILLGGSSVSHFRVRCGQAQIRRDLMPSFWSLAGIMLDASTFASVPLGLRDDNSNVSLDNGVQECQLESFSDPNRFPNIAIIDFAEGFDTIKDNIDRIKGQRSVIDLPALMVPWLAYVWGAGQASNPLVLGQGVPSAVFAETVYGLAGIELTPGLSSASSCPEAIWLSANWWHDFYDAAAKSENQPAADAPSKKAKSSASKKGAKSKELKEIAKVDSFGQARGIIPTGAFALRQREAAVKG